METQNFTFSNDEITKHEEEELEKEVHDEIKNLGDVNDIKQQIPEVEKLNELKKMIDGMSREEVAQILASLANDSQNAINPNKNSFSSVSQREMVQMKMRRKKEEFKYSRMTKGAKAVEKQKYEEKQEQKKQQDSTHSHDHDHSNCTDHSHTHGHDGHDGHDHSNCTDQNHTH